MTTIDLNHLESLHKDGWLEKQTHPTLDLTIWNYSQQTTWEKYWTGTTLMCRGLVTNSNGDIVARPFEKFFNLHEEEARAGGADKLELPAEYFDIYEKLDGSLIILFFYEGQWVVASKGSFTSTQASWAMGFLHRTADFDELDTACTYLFEAIYPENRIVVDYGGASLLPMTAAIHTATGKELPWQERVKCGYMEQLYPMGTGARAEVHYLVNDNRPNHEGYVLHWPQRNLRIKIKHAEYVRLHRLMTGVNARRIWEVLSTGGTVDSFLYSVPEEFEEWVRERADQLYSDYERIEREARTAYYDVWIRSHTRRQFVENAQKDYPELRHLLMLIRDTKRFSDEIWKMLYPPHEQPWSSGDA